MAVRWLGAYTGEDVEDVLAGALSPGDTPTVTINALMALGRAGTSRSLPIVRHLTGEANSSIAAVTTETAVQIEDRIRGK